MFDPDFKFENDPFIRQNHYPKPSVYGTPQYTKKKTTDWSIILPFLGLLVMVIAYFFGGKILKQFEAWKKSLTPELPPDENEPIIIKIESPVNKLDSN